MLVSLKSLVGSLKSYYIRPLLETQDLGLLASSLPRYQSSFVLPHYLYDDRRRLLQWFYQSGK